MTVSLFLLLILCSLEALTNNPSAKYASISRSSVVIELLSVSLHMQRHGKQKSEIFKSELKKEI